MPPQLFWRSAEILLVLSSTKSEIGALVARLIIIFHRLFKQKLSCVDKP
jgi:hypothetical protein